MYTTFKSPVFQKKKSEEQNLLRSLMDWAEMFSLEKLMDIVEIRFCNSKNSLWKKKSNVFSMKIMYNMNLWNDIEFINGYIVLVTTQQKPGISVSPVVF